MTSVVTLAGSRQSAVMAGLARSSVLAFGTYISGAALTYLSQLLIARAVGSTSYGYYAYVLAWVTIFAYVATLGFDVSLLRLIPAYCASGQWSLTRGVLRYAERRGVAAGCVIVLAGGLVLWLLGASLHIELVHTFVFGLALIPTWSLLWMSSSAVRVFTIVVVFLVSGGHHAARCRPAL